MGKIQGLLIASLLASGVLMGLTSFLGDMANKYSFTGNSTALEDLSLIDDVNDEINSTREYIQGQYLEDTGTDTPWSGAWNAAWNFLNTPTLIFNMLNELFGFNNELMLPPWVSGVVFGIVTAIFAFAVMRIFTGRDA